MPGRLLFGVVFSVAAIIVIAGIRIIILRMLAHIDLGQHRAGKVRASLYRLLESCHGRLAPGLLPADQEDRPVNRTDHDQRIRNGEQRRRIEYDEVVHFPKTTDQSQHRVRAEQIGRVRRSRSSGNVVQRRGRIDFDDIVERRLAGQVVAKALPVRNIEVDVQVRMPQIAVDDDRALTRLRRCSGDRKRRRTAGGMTPVRNERIASP